MPMFYFVVQILKKCEPSMLSSSVKPKRVNIQEEPVFHFKAEGQKSSILSICIQLSKWLHVAYFF